MLPEIASPEKFRTVICSVSSVEPVDHHQLGAVRDVRDVDLDAVAIPQRAADGDDPRSREAKESGSASWSGSVP